MKAVESSCKRLQSVVSKDVQMTRISMKEKRKKEIKEQYLVSFRLKAIPDRRHRSYWFPVGECFAWFSPPG